MSRFDECLAFILRREGGYCNNPNDRGGATNMGITQKTYDEWRVRNGTSRNPVCGISAEEVAAIYRAQYWDAVRGDGLLKPLDLCLFDAAVQHGAGRAVKWLQRTVGTRQDGAIGPQTLTALALLVERDGRDTVIGYYMEIREGFYYDIVENDPTQATFLKGWMSRLQHLRDAMK